VKPVGEGASEMRIDYGPGYRVYFSQRGNTVVVLLAGGDKRTRDRNGAGVGARTLGVLMAAKKPKARQAIKTLPWDPAANLKTDQDIANYLEAVFEDGDPALVAAALGDIARAKGMTRLPEQPASAGKAFTKRFRMAAIQNWPPCLR
jgi:probable addiction module antidote protein